MRRSWHGRAHVQRRALGALSRRFGDLAFPHAAPRTGRGDQIRSRPPPGVRKHPGGRLHRVDGLAYVPLPGGSHGYLRPSSERACTPSTASARRYGLRCPTPACGSRLWVRSSTGYAGQRGRHSRGCRHSSQGRRESSHISSAAELGFLVKPGQLVGIAHRIDPSDQAVLDDEAGHRVELAVEGEPRCRRPVEPHRHRLEDAG